MVDTKISGLTGGPSYEHNRLERTLKHEPRVEGGRRRRGGREGPCALLLGGVGTPPGLTDARVGPGLAPGRDSLAAARARGVGSLPRVAPNPGTHRLL